jgi:hypothetical protein
MYGLPILICRAQPSVARIMPKGSPLLPDPRYFCCAAPGHLMKSSYKKLGLFAILVLDNFVKIKGTTALVLSNSTIARRIHCQLCGKI